MHPLGSFPRPFSTPLPSPVQAAAPLSLTARLGALEASASEMAARMASKADDGAVREAERRLAVLGRQVRAPACLCVPASVLPRTCVLACLCVCERVCVCVFVSTLKHSAAAPARIPCCWSAGGERKRRRARAYAVHREARGRACRRHPAPHPGAHVHTSGAHMVAATYLSPWACMRVGVCTRQESTCMAVCEVFAYAGRCLHVRSCLCVHRVHCICAADRADHHTDLKGRSRQLPPEGCQGCVTVGAVRGRLQPFFSLPCPSGKAAHHAHEAQRPYGKSTRGE